MLGLSSYPAATYVLINDPFDAKQLSHMLIWEGYLGNNTVIVDIMEIRRTTEILQPQCINCIGETVTDVKT